MQTSHEIVLEQLMSLQNQLQNARGNQANAKVEFEDLDNVITLVESAIVLINDAYSINKPSCDRPTT